MFCSIKTPQEQVRQGKGQGKGGKGCSGKVEWGGSGGWSVSVDGSGSERH